MATATARIAYPRDHVPLRSFLTAAWLLATEVRAYLEDLDGADGRPELVAGIQVRLCEELLRVDLELAASPTVDTDHAFALVMERGLHGLAALSPEDFWSAMAPQASEARDSMEFVESLIGLFGARLPDSLAKQGQSEMLAALRDWNEACAAAGVDASFLSPLMRDV